MKKYDNYKKLKYTWNSQTDSKENYFVSYAIRGRALLPTEQLNSSESQYIIKYKK